MKCAIMQPTYLPWAGYFNLMSEVDYFVLLDDVQFNKRSWQQRNRIILEGEERFLSVPVNSKGKRYQLIKDVETDVTQEWYKDHLLSLKNAYSKHPFGEEAIELYTSCIDSNQILLKEINVSFIEKIKDILDISTKLIYSSEIPVSGKRSEYLINICNYLDVDTYLSPEGSLAYIEEEGNFKSTTINLLFQEYTPKWYPQKNLSEFIPYLSILDVIANNGLEFTKEYIKS